MVAGAKKTKTAAQRSGFVIKSGGIVLMGTIQNAILVRASAAALAQPVCLLRQRSQ